MTNDEAQSTFKSYLDLHKDRLALNVGFRVGKIIAHIDIPERGDTARMIADFREIANILEKASKEE